MSDAGDQKQVKARRKSAKFERNRELGELNALLKIRSFRRFVWRVMEQRSPLDAVLTHPLETFRQLGEQDLSRFILKECLTADPQSFILMQQEAVERDEAAKNGRKAEEAE